MRKLKPEINLKYIWTLEKGVSAKKEKRPERGWTTWRRGGAGEV